MIPHLLMLSVILILLILWQLDRRHIKNNAIRGVVRKEELEQLENRLQKERRDAIAELNMIQSRLILFMKLESEVIQKEKSQSQEMNQKSEEIKALLKKLDGEKKYWKENIFEHVSQIQTIATEKSIGFPWLAKAYADFFYLQDLKIANQLEYNASLPSEPLQKFREMAINRKNAEEKTRLHQYVIEYYESLFPWLAEFKDEQVDEIILKGEDPLFQAMYSDPAQVWLSDNEFRKLEPVQRNQLALDRFWEAKKSKWEMSRDYDRYITFLLHKEGWNIVFKPLIDGFPDLSRLLLGRKADKILICFAKFFDQPKEINEKLILHFFTRGFEIALKEIAPTNPLLTSTNVVDSIRSGAVSLKYISNGSLNASGKDIAQAFGIQCQESFPLEKYPSIRGRVWEGGEKRYYLPFDKEYDTLQTGESATIEYFSSIEEAEKTGFSRVVRPPEKKDFELIS